MMRFVVLLVAALLVVIPARAAVMIASFEQLAGSTWTIALEVINDGAPVQITGFTVYFPETLFSDLTLVASPTGWDSIVIQPDVALSSPGFFDSLLLDPTTPLVLGEAQGGFRAQFTFLGLGAPPMLPFEIVDQDFNVLYAGTTAPIPETGSGWMLALGLIALCRIVQRRALVGSNWLIGDASWSRSA